MCFADVDDDEDDHVANVETSFEVLQSFRVRRKQLLIAAVFCRYDSMLCKREKLLYFFRVHCAQKGSHSSFLRHIHIELIQLGYTLSLILNSLESIR